MMEKAIRAAIPIVLSKGAPTDRAIQLARAHGSLWRALSAGSG